MAFMYLTTIGTVITLCVLIYQSLARD